MHSVHHDCPCACNVHGISVDSMAEYIFLFLMLLVLENNQNTCNHDRVKNAPRKPVVRLFPANMSERAEAKNTEQYPDEHLF